MLIHYLHEFRKRLIQSLCILLIFFIILAYFANDLYTLLAHPLLRYLPAGSSIIATHIIAPFYIPYELTFIVACFAAIPFFLYQIWVFIAPALYADEKRLIWPLLFISSILFYTGVLFAYFIIFPLLFHFLTLTTPEGVKIMPDISQYLHFTLKTFFIFGLIFEIPVIMVLLMRTGILTETKCASFRPYVIVGAFVLGMLLTPPDVLSQTLLAIPIWLLFECGIFCAKIFRISKREG
jgi:sec-independent protein translocase protein TatC